jgi:hypothetical protein
MANLFTLPGSPAHAGVRAGATAVDVIHRTIASLRGQEITLLTFFLALLALSLFASVAFVRDRKAAERLETGRPIPETLRRLAGLTQIQYVLVYPAEREIVIAGPAAVVSNRPRRPDIHTSVVSTNTDGMPKYTRKPAAGTRLPAQDPQSHQAVG